MPAAARGCLTPRPRRRRVRLFGRYLFTTCQPLGRIVSHELSVKLDAEIALSFDSITSADIMSRSRAWRSMVGTEAAMSPEVAARLAGLEMGDV